MGDRAYTRFSVPLTALDDEAAATAVRRAFRLSAEEVEVILAEPVDPSPSADCDDCSLRLVDGCPCLVWEDSACNYGGADAEDILVAAKVPYLQVNGGGDGYAALSTVFDGTVAETVRVDGGLHPVVRIEWSDGRAVPNVEAVIEFERYARLVAQVLAPPAQAPAILQEVAV